MAANSKTRGLINLGSTCFLNATLQIMSRCDNFTKKLDLLSKDDNDKSGLASVLSNTFQQMKTLPISNPMEPRRLYEWILGNTNQFPAGVQGDPLELMEFVVNCLDSLDFTHFEEGSITCSREYHFTADEFESVDPNGIGLKFQLEPMDDHPTSTTKLVKQYFYRKTGRQCRYCDGDQILKKRIFMDPPNTLLITIGRNCTSGNVDFRSSVKCSADRILNIPVENQDPAKYELIGAIEHEGTQTTSGHFKAIVKDNGVWYCYSDDEITLGDIDPANVYIVVYNKVEEDIENLTNEGRNDQINVNIPMFTIEEINDAQVETNAEAHQNTNDVAIKEFNNRYVQTYKYIRFRHSRILVMCIPKQIEGRSFQEKYQNFLKSNLTVLYTITNKFQKMFSKIRKDPFIKENFDVYTKNISSKIGSYNYTRWIAQAATSFIIHSLLYDDGPRFEFIFDLHVNSLMPKSIIAYWESSKMSTINAMDRITKNKLFCLYTCNHECYKTKDAFHFSLKGMKQVDCLSETEPFSTIKMWSFVDNLNVLNGHPLESLLTPIKIDPTVNITAQVSVKLQECEFRGRRKVHVYLLMIVNDAPKHTTQDLKELWCGTSARFAVYAGATYTGRFRKDHLRTINEGGVSSVSKVLNDSSKVYLVMSKEFDKREDAEEAEAKLISVLKYHELKEMKTGMTNRFAVLNVNNSYVPLYNSNERHHNEILEFLNTRERLFVFHGETFMSHNDDRILKCYLVDEEVK